MAKTDPLKIMYINPVGIADWDGIFADMAGDYKLPGTEVHIVSLPASIGGFTHVEYRTYEAMVMSGTLRAVRAAAREGFDAVAIGCFYDTGLAEARELSEGMIVTAPCQSSCEIASTLANRFGIIVGRRKWVHQMHNTVREQGYGERLSGFYHVELGVNDFQADHAETERRLIAAGHQGGGRRLCRGGDPGLHHGDRLLQGAGTETGRAGHRPVDRGAEAGRIRRRAAPAMRLGALAALVVRGSARRRNCPVRAV